VYDDAASNRASSALDQSHAKDLCARTDGLAVGAATRAIRAARRKRHGKLSDARLHAHRACSLVDGLGLSVVEHCYRVQLGRLSPGTEGARMVDGALESLRALGVAAPERWSALYVACFGMEV
jgi:hypothetical protein